MAVLTCRGRPGRRRLTSHNAAGITEVGLSSDKTEINTHNDLFALQKKIVSRKHNTMFFVAKIRTMCYEAEVFEKIAL